MDLNKAMIRGRLGADPEIRSTQNGTKVANFSLATSEKYKDKNGEQQESTEWHRIVAWGRRAEIVEDYVKKGDLLFVEGKIQTRKWEDKDGVERYTTEINAFRIDMLGSPNRGDGGKSAPKKKKEDNFEVDGGFDDMDDDLPF